MWRGNNLAGIHGSVTRVVLGPKSDLSRHLKFSDHAQWCAGCDGPRKVSPRRHRKLGNYVGREHREIGAADVPQTVPGRLGPVLITSAQTTRPRRRPRSNGAPEPNPGGSPPGRLAFRVRLHRYDLRSLARGSLTPRKGPPHPDQTPALAGT